MVDQVKTTIEATKSYLIRGKFDISECSRPDTVLYEAVNSFFGTFMECDLEDAASEAGMKRRILRAFQYFPVAAAVERPVPSSDTSCLRDLVQSIPNLGRFLGESFCEGGHDAASLSQGRLLQRSQFLLCTLIGAIAHEESPVVLGECVHVCMQVCGCLLVCDELTLNYGFVWCIAV